MSNRWINDKFRKMHFDFHVYNEKVPNVAGSLDAEAITDMLAQAHIEAVCIFGQTLYYLSPHRHPNLKKDYLGEMSKALKRRGIHVLVYMNPTTHRRAAQEHPEWQVTDVQGKPRGSMCLYTPYVKQYLIPLLTEIVKNYDIDGFFFDGSFHQFFVDGSGPCYCSVCRDGFHQEAGGDIPKSADDPLAFRWRLWRNRCFLEFDRKVTEAMRKLKPDFVVASNLAYSSRFPVEPPKWVTYITQDPPTPAASTMHKKEFFRGSYVLHFSYEGRYLSTLGVPFDCMNTRMQHWGDWTLRPTIALQLECAAALANGARCFLADRPYHDGTLEPAVYKAVSETYQFVKNREEYCRDAQPVPYIAVLNSAASHWSRDPLRPNPSWTGEPLNENMLGTHKALVMSGIHFNIINDETLMKSLQSYKTLVLSDQTCLSSAENDAIRGFVKNGGGLIATLGASMRDDLNNPLGDFGLADVLGLHFAGKSAYHCGYIKPGAKILENSDIHNMPLLVNSPFTLVKPTSAETMCTFINPLDENPFPGGIPPPGEPSGYPAITINQFGKGKAIYIATDLFREYWVRDTPDLRKLAAKCIDLVTPQKVIEIEAPPSVEVSLFQQRNNKIVHLLNYHAEKRDTSAGIPNIEFLPVLTKIRVSLGISEKPKKITQMPEGRTLEWTMRKGRVNFTVPQLHIHSVIFIEC